MARCRVVGPHVDVGPNIYVCPKWNNPSRWNHSSGGFFVAESTCYGLDIGLLNNLVKLFGNQSTVVDVGAGVGCYVHALRHAGVDVIAAYDAAAGIERLTKGTVIEQDATSPLPLSRQPDWIYSLEVAEHIPPTRTLGFVQNLASARCGVVVSWAVPGQGGLGHVNNRPSHEVVNMFKNEGMRLDHNATKSLRRGIKFDWFKNALVFRRSAPQHDCASSAR